MQTPLRENKYVSRAYAAFNDTYGSYLGTMLITSDGVTSDFAALSSRYGFIPMVLDSTKDLNDVFNISLVGDDRYAFQLLIATNEELISGSTTPRMYMRSKNNGTWTGWNVITGTLLS